MSLKILDVNRTQVVAQATACAALLALLLAPIAHGAPGVPKTVTPKKVKPEGLVHVVTAMSTPLKSGHPILFLNGSGDAGADPLEARLQFPADQKYSKWSVIFDFPIRVETVQVKTCEGSKPFADGVELFVDYNEKRIYSDGGRRVVNFNVKADARALTLNFLESAGLCLESIKIQSPTEWLRPRTVEAKGSSVIADGSLGMGTRTIVNGGKTKVVGDRKQGEWRLEWENPLIVDGLRIWNGDQSVGDAFDASDRVRELDIRADGGKPQRVTLADRRDVQQVDLKEAQEIRSLDLKSISTFPGKTQTEPLLAEIQLTAAGENWIPIVVAKSSSPVDWGESAEAAQVRERGYADVLDHELRLEDRGDVWKFRFRSDGTFFARIFVEKTRTARGWSVSGTWRLLEKPLAKSQSKSSLASKNLLHAFAKSNGAEVASNEPPISGLAMRLNGIKMATSEPNDSLPCANHCFPMLGARVANSQRDLPVSEQVELQRERRALFILRNRTEPENRTLEFGDLKLRIHSLYD
jgi:hypothetical protein